MKSRSDTGGFAVHSQGAAATDAAGLMAVAGVVLAALLAVATALL